MKDRGSAEYRVVDKAVQELQAGRVQALIAYRDKHPYRCRTHNETSCYTEGYLDGYIAAQDFCMARIKEIKHV